MTGTAMQTTTELLNSGQAIEDGTEAWAIIRNGLGRETGRIKVVYCARFSRFFSIPEDDNQ